MKTTPLLIASAWIVTLVAAFTIGSKSNTPDPSEQAKQSSSSNNIRITQRSKSRTQDTNSTRKTTTGSLKSATNNESGITSVMFTQNPLARNQALIEFINRLNSEDFETVVAEFRGLGITRDRMSEYSMLLHAWAKVDPLAALKYAQENTGTPFARQTILASWAETNPDAALNWAQQNHEGEEANPWLVGVIRGIAPNDLDKATEIMTSLPYSTERGDALSLIVPHIMKLGQAKADAWLNGIEDERLRAGGAAYLAEAIAKEDPVKAAAWVMNLQDTSAIARAAGNVTEAWASQDFDAALNWTNSLTEEAKTNAARGIIPHYASKNPAEASAWVRTMSSEPEYQRLTTSFIWHTARTNPEMSLSHVAEMTDKRSQSRYYSRILDSWRQRDPDTATQWVENNSIPENVRKRFLREADNNDR